MFIFILPALQRLLLVVAAHPRRRGFKRRALFCRQTRQRLLQGFARQLQFADRRGIQAIEAVGVLEHRRIAARLHVSQNRRDGALNRFVLRALKSQQCREARFEISVAARKTLDVHYAPTTPAIASRIGTIFSRLSLSAA